MRFKTLLILPLFVASLQAASVSDLIFTLTNGGTEYSVSDCDQNASGSLGIPSIYNGLPVTSIGRSAIDSCRSLTNITIPNSVTSIGQGAFRNCERLTSITIPDSVTSIATYAFIGCFRLSSITIGDGVTSIKDYTFSGCWGLSSVTIPDGVTSIGEGAFSNNDSLSKIDIPYSVTTIGTYAFRGSGLSIITFDGNAPSVGNEAFAYIGSGFSEPVIYYYDDASGFTSPTWGGVQTEMLIRDTTPSLDDFYESNSGESITIDSTPPDDYPTGYTYQWYFNGFPIPSFLSGTSATYTIDGISSSNGTWRVEVTYDVGTTSAEFEYRVFTDTDGDGLSDYRESNILSINPNLTDTDSDGLNDYDEVITYLTDPNVNDTDADGLSDGAEVNTYSTNPLDSDSDDDGLTDGVEVNTYSTDPNDTDSDDDQLTDAGEVNTHLTNPNLSDSDGDQLSDYSEINSHLTNPNDSDSDNDGLSDGNEVNTHSTNPLSEDTSGDGFTDGFVVTQGADPSLDYSAFRTETLNQIKDARIGSTMIEVSEGKADITMTLEETSNLSDWSNADTSEKTIEVDAPAGTRFYRFKMTD